jgi:predicted nucleic acid-binding protein
LTWTLPQSANWDIPPDAKRAAHLQYPNLHVYNTSVAEINYAILTGMTKIYLDACCLNRPFDDQRQPRIRLESEAIALILEKFRQREWEWIGSEVLSYELGQTADSERKERLLLLARQSHQSIEITEEILDRAEKLETLDFDSYDAIHLASAESVKVDVFLTTDDRMQKIANRNKIVFSFVIVNPAKWLEEVLK